jgi:hypothetical protein
VSVGAERREAAAHPVDEAVDAGEVAVVEREPEALGLRRAGPASVPSATGATWRARRPTSARGVHQGDGSGRRACHGVARSKAWRDAEHRRLVEVAGRDLQPDGRPARRSRRAG